ncbi:MAG: hypothetical protein EOO46_19865 [Flavobacterium sp.]|nr:MAG: hypothetical protein EOO46_19865 [Flavobacterium sp.]
MIIKVTGPFNGETLDESGNTTRLGIFIQTNEFPKYHYVVILDIIESYTAPGNRFYVAKLITHNSGYDNLEITTELYDKTSTTINLTNSYITRDMFLIPEAEVQTKKVYGKFQLDKLQDASEC